MTEDGPGCMIKPMSLLFTAMGFIVGVTAKPVGTNTPAVQTSLDMPHFNPCFDDWPRSDDDLNRGSKISTRELKKYNNPGV